MIGKKKTKAKGKMQLSKYFQEFKDGDFVAIVKEPSVQANFPERIQGRTGSIEGRRGMSYMIKIMDQAKEKKFLIAPIHLRRIKIQKSE
jgi:ribosomal protein L21E